MNKTLCLWLITLPVVLSSCATPAPPQTYRNADAAALIVESLDAGSCRMLAPTPMEREDNARLLDRAKSLGSHQTAVVILENYSEAELGREFRDRSMGWFMGLRGLGYQRIVFLKGDGAPGANAVNGMQTLADYN